MANRESALDVVETDALIGRTVGGRFAITGRIARGGMACVYFATQTQVGRPVAIKVLRPNLDGLDSSAEDFRRRFLREASILSRLQHPNLVTLIDYGQITETVHDQYYIAMEYLRGETLAQRFRSRGRLDVAESVRIARQVGRGLREAHRQGFIHRDLKPSNIMLVPEDDDNDIVKLIDFGVGKAISSQPREQVLGGDHDSEDGTRVGVFLGSPRYMAPEQIRGEPVEARTDLYGLGIVLFQALTGRLPFNGRSHVDLMLAHCSEPPPPLEDHLELPVASLSQLVADLLQKQPSQRPSTDEFLARLADVEQEIFENGGLAGPPGARYSTAPGSGGESQRPPPGTESGRRLSPPPRRTVPPPPRPGRSDPPTLTGGSNSTTALVAGANEAPNLGLFDVPTLSDYRSVTTAHEQAAEVQRASMRVASSRPGALIEPEAGLAPPPVSGPRRSRTKWALLLVATFGLLLWLGSRLAPEAGAPPVPVPTASTGPAVRARFVLRLDSTPPNAVVRENGVALGQTPLALSIERASLREAPRRFSIEYGGYQVYTHQQADSERDVEVVAPLTSVEVARPTSPPPSRPAGTGRARTPAVSAKPVNGLDINLER